MPRHVARRGGDDGVELQFVVHVGALLGPPAMPTARAPASWASCPQRDATGPLAAATTTVSPASAVVTFIPE